MSYRIFVTGVVLSLATVAGLVGCSQEKAKPSADFMHREAQNHEGALKRSEMNAVEIIAVIEKLDLNSRKVTLALPNGKTSELVISDKVQRLSEFKVGDKVIVEHVTALAFEVREPTPEEKKNPRVVLTEAQKAGLDLPPGVALGVVTRTIVKITGIDMETEMVTVKFPKGNEVTFKAKVPENLKRVNVGDDVSVIYAEATAIRLEPFKKS